MCHKESPNNADGDSEQCFTRVLDKEGIWEAQLAREVYSKGQIMIVANENKKKGKQSFPDFLGQGCRTIPDPKELLELIERVSKKMVDGFGCDKVYLASLNEGDYPLHFWLIPRNCKDHRGFLDQKDESDEKINDGFALIAYLRKKFLCRRRLNAWDDMPPPPDQENCEWKKRWLKYANEYEAKFKGIDSGCFISNF